ncbi:maleylacetoacetate isomerase [Oceanimonas doudoroffii]|uniref:Maleylacetoacetate isomerase n=1 Tax=Oceanimonas doudoroffii TaxID=84158 RepID=A0A233RG32_9GAMM|nr:maleylacetoacetate isomerase [Oceanimonas doudoroffii]OXY82342.1 maleylacetoacetate isomerase [Oceanimonas doudoroffii]
MQLYSFYNSSTSYRVRIALALKGLSVDYQGVNLRAGEQRQNDYRALNPAAGVPLLVDDEGNGLGQSLAIIDYLEALHPEPPLLPAEPLLRARALELANLIACDIHPVNNLRVRNYLANELSLSEDQQERWYRHWIAEGLAAAEALLVRHGFGDYCFGDAPTVADCCLVPQVANGIRMNCDLTPYSRVMAVYQHCQRQPAFQQAAPDQQPDFAS